MFSAPTSSRGFSLNCRFAVNGIQNASRLFGEASNSAVPADADMMMLAWLSPVECAATIAHDQENEQGSGVAGPTLPQICHQNGIFLVLRRVVAIASAHYIERRN